MEKKKQVTGHVTAFFTSFVWGTTFICTKILLRRFSPIEILLIRFVLGYLALWLVHPHPLKFTSWKEERCYILAGLTGITMYYLMENIALTMTQASNVGVVVAVAPFFTAICGMIFLHEKKPAWAFYLGFVISMAGICLLSFAGGENVQIHPAGDALAMLAAAVWAVYSTVIKKIGEFGYPTIQTTRRAFFYGIVLMIPCVAGMGFDVSAADFMDKTILMNFGFLSFIACALCFVTWNFAVKRLGPVKTSVYIYLSPVITTVCSALVLHEIITVRSLCGIALVLTGLVLSEFRRKQD